LLWCFRASKIYMARQAANAAAMALALLCTGSLLAKPTRALPHPAHRLVLTQPTHRATRERMVASAHAASGRLHPTAALQAGNDRESGRRLSLSRVSLQRSSRIQAGTERGSRSRTLAEERALAARAAIEAADRGTRGQTRRLRLEGSRGGIERASVVLRRQPGEAAGRYRRVTDTTHEVSPTTLTNIGGVLRPTAGTMALSTMLDGDAVPIFPPALKLSTLYDSQGRLVLPRPLYGSHDILLHQNSMADHDGLDRVQDDADLMDLRRQKKLVPIPESEALRVDYKLPEDRRFSRPWTAAFLSLIAANFYGTFHVPLQVDSAVRTVAVQQRLLRTNGNAAPTTGETASPHLTGQAVDIAKGGLSLTEIAWMRTYLQPLIDLGKIDVEEEFQQSCFHISVYKSFLPAASPHLSVAAARQSTPDSELERPSY
jgi:hypothetical protein